MESLLRDLSVLAEPVRVRLLALLADEELGVSELCRILQLPQSTVSRHLKALRVAGWIEGRTEGTASLYGAATHGLDETSRQLWQVVTGAFATTRQHDEDRARLRAVLAERGGDAFFEQMHASWDRLRSELFGDRFLLPGLLGLLPHHWTVADLGCGTGPALSALAPAVSKVIGVDREPKMLEAAALRVAGLNNVELRGGGLEALPLGNGEVHAATCILVLHHVEDLQGAFREIERVLAPSGRLAIVDMVAHDRADWRRTMGHRHLGFARPDLDEPAVTAGLDPVAFHFLDADPEAQAPPLFVATYQKTG